MKIQILDNAKLDLVDGFHFYEDQEEGIGHYFLDCLYSDIDSLILYAGIHQKKSNEFYWMLSKRFPYAIYYVLRKNTVLVHAVLDCRQNPTSIAQRLNEERTRRWT
jgi:hypothetical protein